MRVARQEIWSRGVLRISEGLTLAAIRALIAALFMRFSLPEGASAMRNDRPSEMTMWYNKPAAEWVEALPVGNGRLGAMVFGSVAAERLQLNEETIWTGSPYSAVKAGGAEALGKIRELIFAGKNYDAHDLFGEAMLGDPVHQQKYQPLGDLMLDFGDDPEAISDYRRELDLETATTSPKTSERWSS